MFFFNQRDFPAKVGEFVCQRITRLTGTDHDCIVFHRQFTFLETAGPRLSPIYQILVCLLDFVGKGPESLGDTVLNSAYDLRMPRGKVVAFCEVD